MEDKLYNKIKESSEKYDEFRVPENAFLEYTKYASKLDSPRKNNPYKWIAFILLATLLISNIYWWSTKSIDSEQVSIKDKSELQQPAEVEPYEAPKYNFENMTDQEILTKDNPDNFKVHKTNNRTKSTHSNKIKVANFKNKLLNSRQHILSSERIKKTDQLVEKSFQSNHLDPNIETINTATKSIKSTFQLDLIPQTPRLNIPIKIGIESIDLKNKIHLSPLFVSSDNLIKRRLKLTFNYGRGFKIKGEPCAKCNSNKLVLGIGKVIQSKLRLSTLFNYENQIGEFQGKLLMHSPFNAPTSPDGLNLHEIEYNLKRMGLAMGIDYFIISHLTFKPFVGISYLITRNDYSNIQFEYRNPFEMASVKIPATTLTAHSIELKIGSDILISKNIDFTIFGSYSFNLDNRSNNLIYINSGFHYFF